MMGKEAVLIAGPTASGKSGLALALAERFGGAIINADSMQVYDGLRILTARPDAGELARAPHHLYGHVPPDRDYSVGAWLREVRPILANLREAGRVPIFCGGTGLYFKALLGSLDAMPDVPPAVRQKWRDRLAEEGPLRLHKLLTDCDPLSAAKIGVADGQRIVRALEVTEASGMPLSTHQTGGGEPLVDPSVALKIVLAPERALLRDVIALRFRQMMEAGALEEARAFLQRPGATGTMAAKAIGVGEFALVDAGEIDEAAAAALAVTRTRQYAKRQETWFRHQLGADWHRFATASAAFAWAAGQLRQV